MRGGMYRQPSDGTPSMHRQQHDAAPSIERTPGPVPAGQHPHVYGRQLQHQTSTPHGKVSTVQQQHQQQETRRHSFNHTPRAHQQQSPLHTTQQFGTPWSQPSLAAWHQANTPAARNAQQHQPSQQKPAIPPVPHQTPRAVQKALSSPARPPNGFLHPAHSSPAAINGLGASVDRPPLPPLPPPEEDARDLEQAVSPILHADAGQSPGSPDALGVNGVVLSRR